MVQVQQGDDESAVSPFIESLEKLLEVGLWVSDRLDIVGPVLAEHGIRERLVYGLAVRKVISFKHIGEKMNGCPSALSLSRDDEPDGAVGAGG
jgi:hypothetical protein